MIRIVVIGTGNVGIHLCEALDQMGSQDSAFAKARPQQSNVILSLKAYYNRSQQLLEHCSAPLIHDLKLLPDCDLILLAIPDDKINTVAAQLPKTNAIVAHTSGSVAMEALSRHKNHGVFYLPQSFSTTRKPKFGDITICLEASDEAVMEVLELVGSTLSRKREHINSKQRRELHLAAVFMNNFVNHCYTKSAEILQKSNISKDLLEPLMRETYEKAIELSPFHAQTGPAIRSDQETIEKHLLMLQKDDRDMYRSITQSIKKTHGT